MSTSHTTPTQQRRVIVLADVGAPDQHRQAVANVARFIAEWKPDAVRLLGDAAICATCAGLDDTRDDDTPRGPAIDTTVLMSTLTNLRAMYDGPIVLSAPGVAASILRGCQPCCGLPGASLADLGVTYGAEPYDPAAPWLSAYVAVTSSTLVYPGQVAINFARTVAQGIVIAGTGLLGIIHHVTETFKLWGMEIGTLRAPHRSPPAAMLGFGVIDDDFPFPVAIAKDGSFTAVGTRYA